MSQQDFDHLYLEKRLRWKNPIVKAEDEYPEEFCEDGPLRTIRKAVLQRFDEEPVPKTDAALKDLYDEVRTEQGFTQPQFKRSGSTIRRWVKERGEPGKRPRMCMGDRRRRGPQSLRIDPAIASIVAEKAEPFWSDWRASHVSVYHAVRDAVRLLNEERSCKGLPALRAPSQTSIWRFLKRHTNYERMRQRHGVRTAGRVFKPIKGSLKASHILEKVIMDHHVVDCHLVDDLHNIPIGRPYLTTALDVHSRYPLACTLSYRAPSVETTMACLRAAVRPKTDLKTRFPEINGEWVAFGLPSTLLVDNAWEFSGVSFKDACEDAGISVEWAPVRTPEYKGICERFFRTINQLLTHHLKGGIPYSPEKLRELGIDPSADAVLLLSEFEELLSQAIVEVYGRRHHTGINAVPEQVWRKDAANVGVSYAPDLAGLDQSLSKVGPERDLTRNGIEFKNLTFRDGSVFDLLNDLRPLAKKRGIGGGVRVKIKYWPEDLSQILVWNEAKGKYFELPCVEEKYSAGLSEHAHDKYQAYAKELGLAFSSENERCAARVRLTARIQEFVASRKIVDRRRAQRILEERRVTAELSTLSTGGNDNIIPVATIENRANGRATERAPVRAKHSPSRRRARTAAPNPEAQSQLPKPPVQNPFDGLDPAAFLKDR